MGKNIKKSEMKWELADIIDLEYFIHRDRHMEDSELDHRDRHIFRDHIEPELEKYTPPDGKQNVFIIRLWLEQRRKLDEKATPEGQALPGAAFSTAYRLFRFLLCVAGIITGFTMAITVLRYTGLKPVNVSYYLGGLVLVQILFLLSLFFLSASRRMGLLKSSASPLYGFLANLIAGFSSKLKKGIKTKDLDTRHQEIRNSFLSALGFIKGRKKVWGNVMYWPLFTLAQIFGVAVNIGILTTTLVRVASTDLAFGWQSTLDLGSQFVYRSVSIIAIPWSWLAGPGTAHPTMTQIEGSRMILKDGIYRLSTQDLTAWWPFLCLCVLFYGLLPRLLLFIVGVLCQRRSLMKLDFKTGDCDPIVTRLLTPLVSSKGSDQSEAPLQFPEKIETKSTKSSNVILKHDTQCIALIPADIYEQSPSEELLKRFPNRFSLRGIDRIKISLNIEEDGPVLEPLEKKQKQEGLPNIFLLFEAWQPPIKETLFYLKALRRILEDHVLIYIGLIGKPTAETIFSPVTDVDFKLWQQHVNRLDDPYIRLERFRP